MLVALVPALASATGLCENTPRHYGPPHAFADATRSFASRVSVDWCEVDASAAAPGERRGSIDYVELRNLKNEVVGRLARARGRDAARLKKLVGAFEYTPKLDETLKARGYRPLDGGSARCRVLSAAEPSPEPENGFLADHVFVDVMLGERRLARIDAGEAARQRKKHIRLRSHFLAGGALAIWVTLPHCEGPPPGYYGKDDPGECYDADEPVIIFKDNLRELSACL